MSKSNLLLRGAGGVAAALALSLTLSSCGDNSSTSSDPVSGTVATPNEGMATVGENIVFDPNGVVNGGNPISIDWWTWINDTKYKAIAEEYMAIHPNVSINVVNQPWSDYWTKLPLELQQGSGPAIFNMHNQEHDTLINFMEPYDIALEDLEADYIGVAAHEIDGEVYYMDMGLMSGAIFYNKDMWEAAGLTDADIPETWDQLREVAKKLTIRDSSGKLTQAGFNFNSSGGDFQTGMAYQLGQNLFKEDQTTVDVDNAANLEVIERFLAIYEDGSGNKDFGTDTHASFGQGQSAMMYAWGWLAGELNTNYPDINWGAFSTPVPVAGQTPYAYDRYNGESTLGISASANAEEKAVAQDFLKFFLTNEDALKDLAISASVYPAYKPLADKLDLSKEAPALAALNDIERYIWPGPYPASVPNTLTVMWQDILHNGVSPKDGLANAQKAIQDDLLDTDFVAVEDRYAFYVPSGN